ncbi:MAG: TetR family transcriptional regulator [Pseudomonadota bacterium]
MNVQRYDTSDVRRRVKQAAGRLFAERGLKEVTVREIALAAGQKNLGVVAYYFSTKEALIREILIDGAMLIEARRLAHLEVMEAAGGPATVLEVVEAIVLPCVDLVAYDEAGATFFNRFLLQLSLGAEGLIDTTLEGRLNTGYQRCLQHLRGLMPDMPLAAKNRRFVFLAAYVGSLLAQREAMMADAGRSHDTWRSSATLADIVRTASALIEAPPA